MKKWTVLAIVILGAMLLVLQYFIHKGEKRLPDSVRSGRYAEEPAGVPLPARPVGDSLSAPQADMASAANSDSLNLPPVSFSYRGACAGGALENMAASHGKYWGSSAKNTAFDDRDNGKMYGFMADYVACVAAARGDTLPCSMLSPSEPSASASAISAPSVSAPPVAGTAYLRTQCGFRVFTAQLIAYVAGENHSMDGCRAALAGWPAHFLSRISLPEFCAAAAKGRTAAREYMLKTMPEYKVGGAMTLLPPSRASCGADRTCLDNFSTYNAVKQGNLSECAKDSPICRALITRSAAQCESTVRAMSVFYCATVEKVKKKSGGYIGASKEQIKADITAREQVKRAEVLKRKQKDKDLQEINKKIRKALGKE